MLRENQKTKQKRKNKILLYVRLTGSFESMVDIVILGETK